MEIVIATSNPHKVEEMRAVFRACGLAGVRLVGLGDVGLATVEPAETGATFEENAKIKAVSYAEQTGRCCLADDSGLEVDALGGRPGVISSHYCTDGREAGMTREQRDRRNNERVMRELEGVEPARRTARFVCVMAVAGGGDKPRVLEVTRGDCAGRIGMPGEVPRGRKGFGYDPFFLVGPRFERTSAELTAEEKNAVSHRGMAARAMAERLRKCAPAPGLDADQKEKRQAGGPPPVSLP